MPVIVDQVAWRDAMDALRVVRGKVFIEEQGIDRTLEWDGLDEDATHFLATLDGKPIGTARLLPTGQIGRMAVLPEYRRTGLGRRLLTAAVDAAIALDMKDVFLHAQRTAEAFYRASEFIPDGEPFVEAGIAHINMTRVLPIRFSPDSPAIPTDESRASRPAQLRTHAPRPTTVQQLRGESAFRDAALQVAQSAHRELRIRSTLLDPFVFDTAAFEMVTSALARRHRQTFVRMLISDVGPMVHDGHRLLALARRIPDKIQIRRPREAPPEGRIEEMNYLIADELALLVQPRSGHYTGFWDLQSAAQAHQRAIEFDQAWERAVEDADVRLLGI